jgi:hypothetical protein
MAAMFARHAGFHPGGVMRVVGFIVAVLAVSLPGEAEGQKKLPALSYDAKLVKFDTAAKGGPPTKVWYEVSAADEKTLGFKRGDQPVTARTRFVYVGAAGTKNFTQKTVLTSEEGKASLMKDALIRVQATAVEAEEIRFGPGLKPTPPKRVR